MIDQDLDYCTRQIEAQEDEMRPVREALKEAKADLLRAEKAVEDAKKEKERCRHVVGRLENRYNNLRCVFNRMTEHRRQLKQMKKMLKYQNDYITKEEKKCQK